ncbi:hypothetical protein ACLB2K_044692 [Fragaria x ananassa]
MYLTTLPSPKTPITPKTLTIPLTFFFTHYSTSASHLDQISVDNTPYWTKTIHHLCTRHRNVDQALHLLDHLHLRGYRPVPLNLTSIVHALCDSHRFDEAHHRFANSIHSDCVPDQRTCNVIIARLLDSQTPHTTLNVLRLLSHLKPDFVASLVNYNRLMDQLCSLRRPSEAHTVLFDMMSRGHCPNAVSYTTLINGYCGMGELSHAHKMFDEMCEREVAPNSMTYSVLISGVLRKRDIRGAVEMMGKLWEAMKGEDDTLVKNAAFSNLIESMCREGYFQEVFGIAEDRPQGESVNEEFAYGQMIDSLCKAGRYHGASRIVYIMRHRGFVPRVTSYNCIVHGLTKEGEGGVMRAYQLLEEGIEFGYLPSEYTYKVLVEGLCQESDVDKAWQTECQPDVITLNIVVNGFCKMGRVEEALKVLDDMMTGKFCAPNVVTFTTIINGLLNVGRTQEALYILHDVMPQKGFRPNVVTYNAVLRGLFKLDQGKQAMEIFNGMVTEGVAASSTTYTIIIDGLCESDQLEEAKRFWDDVIWPAQIHDNFVYAAIIKGICHSGNFDEACHFLYELVDSGVSPNIFSYNIVIDTACKLGLKKEAYEVVREMKRNGLSPDSVTWRILDKFHGNARKEFGDDEDSQSRS